MEELDPLMNSLARRLQAHSVREQQPGKDPAEAMEQAWQKLYARLADLIGSMGFYAVADRALKEAEGEFPFLKQVHPELREGFHLKGLRESLEQADPAEVQRGCAAALGRFLALLGSLIGRQMTLELVRRIWPELPPSEAGSGGEETGR